MSLINSYVGYGTTVLRKPDIRRVHGILKTLSGQIVCPKCNALCPEGKAEKNQPLLGRQGMEIFTRFPEKATRRWNLREGRHNKGTWIYITCDQYEVYQVVNS